VKAPAFEYYRPKTVLQAIELLQKFGDEAQILAGGQSLVPMLNMRLAQPAALIDVNGIQEISHISEEADTVRIGATARYFEIGSSSLVRRYLPLLTQAMPLVAHVAIRNRGTIGGSICLSDPAAELPACCLAMGATMILAGPNGTRSVPADSFATGLYETARAPNELLVGIVFPKARLDERFFIEEFSRRRGDFAIVGVVGRLKVETGIIRQARVVFFGCGATSVLATRTAKCFENKSWSEDVAATADAVLAEELEPLGSIHGSVRYRRKIARVLLRDVIARSVH
jgi:carbon-monoxide dehydrogenase medium subunit